MFNTKHQSTVQVPGDGKMVLAYVGLHQTLRILKFQRKWRTYLNDLDYDPKGSRAVLHIIYTAGRGVRLWWEHSRPAGLEWPASQLYHVKLTSVNVLNKLPTWRFLGSQSLGCPEG